MSVLHSLPTDVQHLIIPFIYDTGIIPYTKQDKDDIANNPYSKITLHRTKHSILLITLRSQPLRHPWCYLTLQLQTHTQTNNNLIHLGYFNSIQFLALYAYHSEPEEWYILDIKNLCIPILPSIFFTIDIHPKQCTWSLSHYINNSHYFNYDQSIGVSIIDCHRAMIERLNYYRNITTEYPLENNDSIKMDCLGFQMIRFAWFYHQSLVKPPHHHINNEILDYILNQETRLFQHRLKTCLSTDYHLWNISQSFDPPLTLRLPNEAETKHLATINNIIYNPKGQIWIVVPFDTPYFSRYLAKRSIYLYKGNMFIHLGHVYDMIKLHYRNQIYKQCFMQQQQQPSQQPLSIIINERFSRHFKAILTFIKTQIISPTQSVGDNNNNNNNQYNISYDHIDQILPACMRKMKQHIKRRHLSKDDPYHFFTSDRLLYLVGMITATQPIEKVKQIMMGRISLNYPKNEQNSETNKIIYDIEDLYKKKQQHNKKLYEFTCCSVQDNKRFQQWCPYDKDRMGCIEEYHNRIKSNTMKSFYSPIAYIRDVLETRKKVD